MKVKFLPQGIETEIADHETVLEVAQRHGIFIKAICGGAPSCAECRVRVVAGEANVLPPNVAELSLIGSGHFIDRRRLACKLMCVGDIEIDLSEQVEKKRKEDEGVTKKSLKTMRGDHFEEVHHIEADGKTEDEE